MRILCVSTLKNEGPFLIEWLAHLMGAGVTDFLLYSNDCKDGTDVMLDVLDRVGVIEHIPQTLNKDQSPQWIALRHAWKHPKRKSCDWAIVCDVDEFPNIHIGSGTFGDVIGKLHPETEAVTLPWRLFGNNGHLFFKDGPITEQFTASATKECAYPVSATFFKSLIRTDGRFNQFGVHRPNQKSVLTHGSVSWADGAGRQLPEEFSNNPNRLSLYGFDVSRDWIECNHYSLKSAQSFMIKRDRGLPNRSEKNIDLAYWVDRNFNTYPNTSISRMRKNTEYFEKQLLDIPNLNDLRTRSIDWHNARFEELIQSESEHSLFSQVSIAGNSQELSKDVSRQLIKWFQENYYRDERS